MAMENGSSIIFMLKYDEYMYIYIYICYDDDDDDDDDDDVSYQQWLFSIATLKNQKVL